MSLSSAYAIPAILFELDRTPTGVGTDAALLRHGVVEAVRHYQGPVSRRTLTQQFRGLADTWREETKFSSSATDLILNSAYQRIIGLGPEVVPEILRSMEEEPDHWFAALAALTGVNPVAPEAQGRLGMMTQAWLDWGKEQGLISR